MMNAAFYTFGQFLSEPLFCSSGVLNAVNSSYSIFYNPSLTDTNRYTIAGSVSANYAGLDL